MNKKIMFLLGLTMHTLLVSCKTTPDDANRITRIPYSMVAEDIEFWNERKESSFASLQDFLVRIKTEESFELYLINQKGEKRPIANSNDGQIDSIQLPKMALEEAKNWTLIVDKPEWQVTIVPAIKVVLPTKKVRYRDLFVVLKDYDRRRDERSELPSWLRQDYYRFFLTFPNPSYVLYENNEGKQIIYGSEKEKTLILKLNEEFYKENGWLVFSELPDMIMPLN